MSTLPGQAVELIMSSTQNEGNKFVKAAPPVSVKEALVKPVETPQSCCELVYASKPDSKLFNVLTCYSCSKLTWLYSTWSRAELG